LRSVDYPIIAARHNSRHEHSYKQLIRVAESKLAHPVNR
jgi:hypothetical protein